MIVAHDAGTRRLAARILIAQAATTIGIAVLCVLIWDSNAALSALAGGGIGLIANALMMLMVLGSRPGAPAALGRLMIGQLLKVIVTVGLLLLVVKGGWAQWPPLLIAYAATLLVYWFVPAFMHRTRRARD